MRDTENIKQDINLQNMDLSSLEGLSPEEKKLVFSILKEMATEGTSKTYEAVLEQDYAEIPVDIITFVDDYNYLGNAWHDVQGNSKLYPYWRRELKKLFPTNIDTNVNNVILSGSRGRGKTEIAILIAAYLLHRILCLKNPIEYFHLKSTEKIVFAFMNIKLALAEEIADSKFQNTIKSSPWFLEHGKLEGRTKKVWVPQTYINSNGEEQIAVDIKIGSQADDLIGLPIYYCFFDEVSFQRNQDIEKQKKKANDMIDTAIGGMKTRFVHKGKNPTLLVLASSKRSNKSFLEEHMKKKLVSEKENVYISDGPVWEVKPKGTYSEETFGVAVGNQFLQSVVIPDEDNEQFYIEKGYKIIHPPIDFKADFIDDIDRALCDFAGISSSSITKYISGAAVTEVIVNNIYNPFQKEILEIGDGEEHRDVQYYNFFDLSKINKDLRNKPLFIHLDMSYTGDMTGIAGVFIKGKRPSVAEDQSGDLFYSLAFSVNIKAPKGRHISFEKNRNFIYWLKEKGFNIKGITSDTFQAYDTGETLRAKGYPYSVLSVDRVDAQSRICKPYQYLKSTIYEKRIEMYEDKILVAELIDLERNIDTGKVDHPDGGAKDIADATCLGPDTLIYLLDGNYKTIKELYDEKITNNSTNNWVLAYNTETGNIEPVKIADVVNNGYRDDLIKLTLDNGKEIICTPDHKLLTRKGDYIQAQDSLNVSLMPFNYTTKKMFKDRTYPYIYIPQDEGNNKGIYLHKLVCENLFLKDKLKKIASKKEDEFIVIHHKDCNRFNNTPENLEYLTNVEHSEKHTALNNSEKKRQQLRESNRKRILEGTHPFLKMSKEQHQENGRKGLTKLNKSEAHRKAVSESNKKLAEQGLLSFQRKKSAAHTPQANLKRQKTCTALYGDVGFKSDLIQDKCRQSCLKRNGYDNPFHSKEKQFEMRINKLKKAYDKILDTFDISKDAYMSLFDFKLYCYILDLNGVSSKLSDITAAKLNIDINNFDEVKYRDLRNKGNCVRLFLKDTNKDCFTYEEFLNYYEEKCLQYDKNKKANNFKFRFKNRPSYEDIVMLGFKIYNHRVVKIEKVPGDYVYDLKLDKIHNFALAAGIFVHNCGAVFNASSHAAEFAYNYGETSEHFLRMNDDELDEDYNKKQLTVDLQNTLLAMGKERLHPSDATALTKTDDYNLYDDIIIL